MLENVKKFYELLRKFNKLSPSWPNFSEMSNTSTVDPVDEGIHGSIVPFVYLVLDTCLVIGSRLIKHVRL